MIAGSPPKASATSWLDILSASGSVFSFAISVIIELVAIAAAQPNVSNFIYFDEIGSSSPTGITEVKNTELMRFVKDGVELSGFAAYTTVTIYNLQGQQIGAYRTDGSGSLNISLADREQGIYIIKANKSTLKIKK